MINYTLRLTQAENTALGYISANQQDWIDNAVHERCRIAIDEIVALAVERCLSAGIQIPGSKDDIVMLAKTQGWLERRGEL
jgi:hypothetical protein